MPNTLPSLDAYLVIPVPGGGSLALRTHPQFLAIWAERCKRFSELYKTYPGAERIRCDCNAVVPHAVTEGRDTLKAPGCSVVLGDQGRGRNGHVIYGPGGMRLSLNGVESDLAPTYGLEELMQKLLKVGVAP